MLATAAGLMLGDYFFLSEHEAMGAVRETERIAIGLYSLTTTLCVMLFENLHNRIRRLEHALDRAQHHHHPHADASARHRGSHIHIRNTRDRAFLTLRRVRLLPAVARR